MANIVNELAQGAVAYGRDKIQQGTAAFKQVAEDIRSGPNATGRDVQFDIRRLQRMRMQGSDGRTFGIRDYNWSSENQMTTVNREGVQRMIIQEFQPDPIFDVGKMIDGFVNGLTSAYGGQTAPAESASTDAKGFLGPFFGSVAKGVAAGAVQPLTEMYIMQKYYGDADTGAGNVALGFPMDLIKYMFPGVYLGIFHLPYFEEMYLDTSYDRGYWDQGGSQRVLGSKMHDLVKDSMNIDFPTAPTWKHDVKAGSNSFSNKFFLINDTSSNLVKNFKFLHALISGTFWLQMSIMQKSPNVYKVTVPGRFTKWICDMSCTCTMEGKLRTNAQAAGQIGYPKAITKDTLFPDVYKVELKFTDLAPNHFNNYMDFLVNGDPITPSGTEQIRKVTNPLDLVLPNGAYTSDAASSLLHKMGVTE